MSGPTAGSPVEHTVDVAVVGAGPHGLTVAAFLANRFPGIVDRLMVLDPTGSWLATWDRRFAAFAIDRLRSPGVHHPHPDPGALLARSRPEDLAGSFAIPSSACFRSFCHAVIAEHGLEDVVTAARVVSVEAVAPTEVHLALDGGDVVRSRRVVIAADPAVPRLPAWVAPLVVAGRPGVDHAEQVVLDDPGAVPAGGLVVVVGGGLTAAHLAIGAARRGASVVLLARRPLRASTFDVDPGWLGPKRLAAFWGETDRGVRRMMIDGARDGGSIPAAVLGELDAEAAVTVRAPTTIRATAPRGDRAWCVTLDDGAEVVADRVWLATGWRVDVGSWPVLEPLRRRHPVAVHDGLPVLDDDLAWAGTGVHCTGALAALQVGPAARNLVGARHAATLIVASVGRDRRVAGHDR